MTNSTHIRGMNKELWKRFRASVVGKHGKSRKKHSLVAQELNNLIERYLDGEFGNIHGTHKITQIKQNLREMKQEKGILTKRDVDVAIAKTGVYDSRTAQNYIWNLENTGFFKEIDVQVKVNSIVKYKVINEEDKKIAESVIACFKKKNGEESRAYQ